MSKSPINAFDDISEWLSPGLSRPASFSLPDDDESDSGPETEEVVADTVIKQLDFSSFSVLPGTHIPDHLRAKIKQVEPVEDRSCRHGAKCSDADCKFVHPTTRTRSSSGLSQEGATSDSDAEASWAGASSLATSAGFAASSPVTSRSSSPSSAAALTPAAAPLFAVPAHGGVPLSMAGAMVHTHTPLAGVAPGMCRYGTACRRAHCHFSHGEPASAGRMRGGPGPSHGLRHGHVAAAAVAAAAVAADWSAPAGMPVFTGGLFTPMHAAFSGINVGNHNVCRYGADCFRQNCSFTHPPSWSPKRAQAAAAAAAASRQHHGSSSSSRKQQAQALAAMALASGTADARPLPASTAAASAASASPDKLTIDDVVIKLARQPLLNLADQPIVAAVAAPPLPSSSAAAGTSSSTSAHSGAASLGAGAGAPGLAKRPSLTHQRPPLLAAGVPAPQAHVARHQQHQHQHHPRRPRSAQGHRFIEVAA